MEVTHPDREGVEYPFTTDGYLHGSEDYLSNFVTEKQKGKIKNLKVLKDDDEGRYSNMEDGLYFQTTDSLLKAGMGTCYFRLYWE